MKKISLNLAVFILLINLNSQAQIKLPLTHITLKNDLQKVLSDFNNHFSS